MVRALKIGSPPVVVAVIVMFAFPIAAQADPFGGAAIGIGLDKLGNAVDQAVQEAVGGGLILEVQAGGQVSVAIQQAKAVYDQESDKTFADLDAQQQATLNTLAGEANDFVNKTDHDLTDIENRAQGTIHDLPFSKDFPQLYSYGPSYTTQTDDADIKVTLQGDFYDVARDGYDANISVGGQTFKNVDKSTTSISFNIPMQSLQRSDTSVSSNNLQISVPYQEPTFIFFHKEALANFIIPLMVLPKSLGTLSFAITTVQAGTTSKNVVSQEMQQESGDDDIKCGGEHADQAVHIAYPDAGWTVIPSSVTWNVTWSQGDQGVDQDWWLASNCSSATTACLCVSTEHHGWGTSGKVHFQIVFTEEMPVNTNTTTNQTVAIGWGESRVVDLPVNASWTGSYVRFDNKTFQFNNNYSDDFISVQQLGTGINIRAAPFSDIDMEKFIKQLRIAHVL